MTPGDEGLSTLTSEARVNAYLRLYERQMSHYENTQGIEWKVNIGVWTLLAAATVWASKNAPPVTWTLWWFWTLALMLIVAAHVIWLRLVHASEEEDKKLWCRYRARVETILGAPKARRYRPRSGCRKALWLFSEAGVTLGMAIVLWSLVTTPLGACCPRP